MSEDQAGIYFDKGSNAPAAYLALPDEVRSLLRDYLLRQQKTLGMKDVEAKQLKPFRTRTYEWFSGFKVHWRIALDPRISLPSVARLSSYRIEVLHIETPK